MTETLWDFIGWYGTIAVLGAFALCMFGVLPWGGNVFMIANLSGAAALVIANLIKRNWYMVVFYLVWGIITAMKYFNLG